MTMIPIYVGTYTRPAPYLASTNGEGLYSGSFDTETGEISGLMCTEGIENCSFLTVSPDGTAVHAIWEVVEWPVGLVSSYAVEGGGLRFLGLQSSKGALACYVTVTPGNDAAFVANYLSGSVARFPVGASGALGEAMSLDQHVGTGPDFERQEGPHAHCIVLDPAGEFVHSADLGTDSIIGYRASDPSLTPMTRVELPPGTGPRHLVFHPTRPIAFVVGEMSSTITALTYDPETGQLSTIGTHPLLPESVEVVSHAADVHVHPIAGVVYCSNRGHGSISVFAINADGDVRLIASRSTEGATPRNFAVSPDGRYLLAANQDSDNIVVIAIDPSTGALGDTVGSFAVPTPACVRLGS